MCSINIRKQFQKLNMLHIDGCQYRKNFMVHGLFAFGIIWSVVIQSHWGFQCDHTHFQSYLHIYETNKIVTLHRV